MARYFPPVNFGMVEDNLYRSGLPTALNFSFLERLDLKTVIYLAHEQPSEQFANFVEEQEIRLFAPALGTESAWNPIAEDTVLASLEQLLDQGNYPLLVTCNSGRHRTGSVVACLRKIQRWNLTSIFDEYRRYAGAKVRLLHEQFIELFDTDLVRIPEEAPGWL